ncbi:MAG TPA: sigma-54 dependent transcriptional regulator [Chitinophagaceae bacterium]|jgi:two-component system response regulator HydG|nr:sigma-54 dependent transcriptional regulator [Chitinophagaceae bacterium]
MKKRVLIIDDDMDMCTLLSRFLSRNGYDTDVAYSGQKGIAKFEEESFDAVLCDFRLGNMDGKEVLLSVKKYKPDAIVLIITGYSDIKTAIDVIKQGAYDYITKPLIPDEVLSVLNKALEQPPQLSEERNNGVAKAKIPGKYQKQEFLVGEAPATKDLYQQIEIVAPTNYSIILYGESGTGKEVIAKTIHKLSHRKDKPFVAMDCGTLSKELAGSELFGHVKGAFTGASADKEGHFELANGGTLFLDEVGNLSVDIQAALLRVIQERKFKRVGGNKEMDVDVRIIVASNENLQEAYQRGKFREDLYHRFNEFSINLPPLRNRRQDIPPFAEFFLQKTNEELGKDVKGFEPEVIEMFLKYSWPGNLREFRNVVRRAVLLTQGEIISAKTLPWEITNTNPLTATPEPIKEQTTIIKKDIGLKGAASKAEYETIMNVLKEVKFNKKKAAEVLNIDRKTLYNKLKSYEEFFEQ